MVRQWLSALTNLVFPRTCFGCNKKIENGILCAECFEKITFLNPPFRGKLPLKGKKEPHLDSLISVTLYREPIVSLLHLFKYRHYEFLKDFFSSLMLSHLRAWGLNRDYFDCISAVPGHYLRLREREYSQTGLLAQKLAEGTGISLNTDLIRCVRAFPSQTKVPLAKRRQNVKGVFSINKPPKGLKIMLVDDVFTTGATLSECSALLKKHGAKSVTALTLAKAA